MENIYIATKNYINLVLRRLIGTGAKKFKLFFFIEKATYLGASMASVTACYLCQGSLDCHPHDQSGQKLKTIKCN